MSIPSLPDTFRAYLRFVNAKASSDHYESWEYSAGALDVVMEFIADHIDTPLAQALAYELGKYEVGADDGA